MLRETMSEKALWKLLKSLVSFGALSVSIGPLSGGRRRCARVVRSRGPGDWPFPERPVHCCRRQPDQRPPGRPANAGLRQTAYGLRRYHDQRAENGSVSTRP